MSVRLRLSGLLLAACCLLALGAASGAPGTPAFDHDAHKAANDKAGLSCMSCHSLGPGGTGPTGMKATLIVERGALCHGCHAKGAELPIEAAAVVKGPRACDTCHAIAPQPSSHGAGWREGHGADARLSASACRECHARRDCVDCHERKESARFRVHDRSWEWVHGIAARTDPASCDGCHLQADCVACHATDHGRAP
jgi:hypothetical protein